MTMPIKPMFRACMQLTAGLLAVHCAMPAAEATLPQPVVWSAAQVRAAGLQIVHGKAALYRRQLHASATVRSTAALLRGLSALHAAQAQAAAAQSRLDLARLQARRAKGLYAAGQNVALASVQQAQAKAMQAQAEVRSAQAAVQLAQDRLTADLGPALAARLDRDPALQQAILSGRELMVDLSLPPGQVLPPQPRVRLRLPAGGQTVPAWVIGPAAAASSQSQGLRETLVTPDAAGLMPGLRLQAEVTSGQAQSGVWLPASAVVWNGGQAVAFVATPAAHHAQRFAPRAVSTTWPLDDGYVQPGWTALDLVTYGAVLLLTPPPQSPAAPRASGGDED